jgi:uncharacterized protein YfaS (alpha-2-macroglobulin family)
MTVVLGETVKITNDVTDFDGNALTPDSQEITIYDPNGVLKDTNTSPQGSAGSYFITYTIPSDGKAGDWKVLWKVVKGTDTGIEPFWFNVDEP